MRVIAFDCFGTLFNMQGVSREEIQDYVAHVNRNDFSPYKFPDSWWNLKLHKDVKKNFALLQERGLKCVALSNGSVGLLAHVAKRGGIEFDHIVDLAAHGVYKPHVNAYRTIQKDLGYLPADTLMVTANPRFGDLEGAALVGMPSQVIRHGYPEDLADLLLMFDAKRFSGPVAVRDVRHCVDSDSGTEAVYVNGYRSAAYETVYGSDVSKFCGGSAVVVRTHVVDLSGVVADPDQPKWPWKFSYLHGVMNEDVGFA